MHKLISTFATVGCLGLAAPTVLAHGAVPSIAAQPLWSAEHYARVREAAHLNEQRAGELDPIIARDRAARHDVEVNWVVLERHAREMHAKAAEFRGWAANSTSDRGAADLNRFASDLDTFATHDEENARAQHEIGDKLDRAISKETDVRDQHTRMAQRLRDWLAANGG